MLGIVFDISDCFVYAELLATSEQKMLATIALALTLFISTNIDDIFVILSFFADPKFHPLQIALGQYLGLGTLVVVSILASLISLILPPGYIGLLGVVPIGIGLNKLFSLWRSDEEAEEGHKSGVGNIFVVIAVTVANGADNIGVYVPVFATRTSTEISIIVLVFIVMVAMWLLLAHALVNHPVFGVPIRRYGHVIVPFALIAIGLMVLAEAGTISLLWAIT